MARYQRTLHPVDPAPASGRAWIARAVLEAPDTGSVPVAPRDFTAIEATATVLTGKINAMGRLPRGWYCVQYWDGVTSEFTQPVLIDDKTPIGRVVGGLRIA